MEDITKIFGSMVFSDKVMKERLPEETYNSIKRIISEGTSLDIKDANIVANAMKEWAIENGATHYTHWFQPMTGVTAEKHDSFIVPVSDCEVILEFKGKELIKGEPDASSFPSGGLRATFEARGYTAWDPTSYAFIKENTLCIPTAFCSFGGEALDKKTPLLRSMEAINRQAMRILRLFGNTKTKRVITTVGGEQEYFLISKEMFEKRKDLIFTGRTLFGAKPPKGQELEDHYFGSIKTRVKKFMEDLDIELWKLGVFAKTEHNEAAPSQHELAPVYSSTNISTDHNQITMDTMKKVAQKHGLVCLLHEKPFEGVNGSGKHNNWSLSTDDGINLLDPGKTPHENAQFLLFLCAVIKAADDYQDLLRVSVASAGNDHRLGAAEAPPAIISIFLGDELMEVLDAIEKGVSYGGRDRQYMKIGAHVLPTFPKDSTDRNRTSPLAFTGNKFEFRMPGSNLSLAGPNIMLNTTIAESLEIFADRLEKAENFNDELNALIKETITEHKRILFNGNNYSSDWEKIAEERGLLNLKTTVDALPSYIAEKNIKLFEKHGIFSEKEAHSRFEILLDNYNKTLHIEALTMVDIAKKEIIPAVCNYTKDLSEGVCAKKKISPKFNCALEEHLIEKISDLSADLLQNLENLDKQIELYPHYEYSAYELGKFIRDNLIPAMNDVRKVADELETIVGKEYWPFPTYEDLLFNL